MPILGVVASSKLTAAGDYELITAYDLAATSTSINFNSIPQTYTHLEIRGVLQGTQGTNRGNSWNIFTINSNAAQYDYQTFRGYENNAADSQRNVGQSSYVEGDLLYQGGNTNVFQTLVIKINNYSDTTRVKNWTLFSGWVINTASQNRITYSTGVTRSTAAITSLTFPNSNTSGYAIGSSLRLYGIKS